MSYLFSQIAISLLLAGILGAAIGWLIHRARAGKEISRLRQTVGQQQQHVNEAQTEVSMIAADFDDLKHNSDLQINELQSENQKIPALNQNLEKSQLLVRQLLQKHKAEFDELSIENEKLSAKAKLAADRETTINKLQAQLDSQKQSSAASSDKTSSTDTKTAIEANANLQASTDGKPSNEKSNDNKANNGKASNNEAKTSATNKAESKLNSEIAQKVAEERAEGRASGSSAATLAGAAALTGVVASTTAASTSSSTSSSPSAASSSAKTPEPTLEQSSKKSQKEAKRLPLSANLFSASALSNSVSADDVTDTENELEDLRAQLASDAVTEHESVAEQTEAKADDIDKELEQLFDPVDHQDDLKQIFGIGPVTEQTLNKLGITAYSQLAELKQHDIEKIADALQIFPGRIERDNWVGSARTQLEEVLEEL